MTTLESCGRDLTKVPEESGIFLFYFSALLLGAAIIYFPLAVYFFLSNRNKHARLYRRHTPYILIFTLGLFLHVALYTSRNIVGPQNMPCAIFFFLASLQTNFMYIPMAIRLFSLYLRIRFNKKLLKESFYTLQQGTLKFIPGEETFKSVSGSKDITVQIPQANIGSKGFDKRSKRMKEKVHQMSKFWKKICCFKEVDSLPKNVETAYFLSTSSFHYKFYFILSAVIILGFNIPIFINNPISCKGCRIADINVGYFMLPFCLLLTWFFLMYLGLRKHTDPLGIKLEMGIISIIFIIFNGFSLLGNFFLSEVEEEGKWDWSMIASVQMFFFGYITLIYQVQAARKFEKKGNQGEVDIHTILEDPEGTRAFALFLAVHLSIENLYFYKAVESWKKSYSELALEPRLEQAKCIFDVFLGSTSTFQINLGYLVLEKIRLAFEDEIVDEIVFDEAQKEAFQLLSGGVFYQFLQSKYYSLYKNNIDLTDQL